MRFLVLLLLLFSLKCYPSDQDQALKNIQRALLSYPQIKLFKKKFEIKLMGYLPMERQSATIFGSMALTLIRGHIDTKSIRNMESNFLGSRVRPDIYYNLRTGESRILVGFNWNF